MALTLTALARRALADGGEETVEHPEPGEVG